MAFPEDQLTYLGATIQSINSSLGWSSTPSSLSINLVEDAGQTFIIPQVGTPTYFDYNGWKFGGIIKAWKRNRGQSGFIFDVTINDPRELLSGTQVILFGYTGITFGLPNIYNVYGYLESSGFGNSGTTSASGGMNGILLVQTLQSLITTTPISYLGHSYYVDLANLLSICGTNYRVTGHDKLTLLELIEQISNDAICDYFIRLEYRNGTNYIVPHFISRANPPVFTAIENFVNTAETTYGTVSNSVGRELISEPTSKMIVGGYVNKLYYLEQNASERTLSGEKDDGSFYWSIDEDAADANPNLKSDYSWVNTPDNGEYIDWREKIRNYAKQQAEEANIWPYWGHDSRGDLVIGYGYPNSEYGSNPNSGYLRDRQITGDHKMIIDGRPIAQIMARHNNGIVDPYLVDYLTDVGELAFALQDFDEWLRYILLTSAMPLHHNRFYEIKDGFKFANGNTPDSFSDKFYTKAEKLHILMKIDGGLLQSMDYWSWVYAAQLSSANDVVKEAVPMSFKPTSLITTFITDLKSLEQKITDLTPDHPAAFLRANLQEVYEYIRQFAEKHLGRTYMVRTPDIGVRRDTETGDLQYSVKPSDGGYFEESVWDTAIDNNLMPSDVGKLTTDDGRISSYVRFTNRLIQYNGRYFGMLNPYKIGEDSLVVNVNDLNPSNPYDDYFYVKVNVHPTPVFLNNATLESPRFVVELPKPMNIRLPINWVPIQTLMYKILVNEYQMWAKANGFVDSFPTPTELRAIWKKSNLLLGYPGNDGFVNSKVEGPCIMPDLAVIAFESQTERYGPWFVEGLNGNTEFTEEDSLVPWNFGSYAAMNTVANSMLIQAAANRTEVETGSIEFPGAPTFLLGDAMVENGPVISNISVNMTAQGVTTTYTLSTWTPQFGVIPTTLQKKISNNQVFQNKLKKSIRDINRGRSVGQSNINVTAGSNYSAPRSKSMHSSMTILGAAQLKYGEDEETTTQSRVASLPAYYIENQGLDSYENKAFMSMDGLYRPFKTDPDASGYPHFERPTEGATSPTVDDLNPFKDKYDIQFISKDVDPNNTTETNLFSNPVFDDINNPSPSAVKAISLAAPLILTGWGRDTNGKPVPADPDNPDEYYPNHRLRQDLWKSGPVDLPWDDDRKVWVGGGTNIYIGETMSNIYAGGSGNISIYNPSGPYSASWSGTNTVMAYETLLPNNSNFQIYKNTIVILSKINDNYYIINAGKNSCTG